MNSGTTVQAGASRLLLGSILALAMGVGPTLGCRAGNTATPDDLRQSWAKALKNNDPDAAWALMTPQAQARTSKDDFVKRWERERGDHAAQVEAANSLKNPKDQVVLGGRTTHEGGRELRWSKIGDDYFVTQGLPGQASTLTAEGTIRAFLSALRRSSGADFDALATPELIERVGERWRDRADAIEDALETPGSLELSPRYDRAVLRYGNGGAIVLERTDRGWRVADLR